MSLQHEKIIFMKQNNTDYSGWVFEPWIAPAEVVTYIKPQSLAQKLTNAPEILTGIEEKNRLFPVFVAKLIALMRY